MSEARDAVETAETGNDEAAFEAARVEQEAGDEVQLEGDAEEGEKPAVDWQKRAIDKEGLAAKERAKRREAERQVRELNERLTKLETRTTPASEAEEDDLLSAINALRDDDEDPITDLGQMKKAMKAFIRQQSQDTEAESKANAERARIQTLARAMDEAEADFADEHPDYKDAVAHFKAARREEFEDMGYAGQALEMELGKDFLGLVQRVVSSGGDPAQVVYNLAKKRGFQSGKAAAETKLKEIARAAEAGKGATGGPTGENRLTPEAVNKLKGPAYDAAWEKLRQQERRAG